MLEALPDLPNTHAIAVMLLTVVALYLFSKDEIPIEVTSLGLLAALTAGFALFQLDFEGYHLDPTELFSGFGHEALVAVCGLMVVGQGLVRTGALEPIGRFLAIAWKRTPFFSLAATLLVAATLSAFINNTPIVVLLLPILMSVCLSTRQSAAAVLMPMWFATLVGGMATTIGTSTNLLVVSIAASLGMERFGMFDFVLPAAIAGSVALLYLWLIAPRLLPHREIELETQSPRLFDARLLIDAESRALGKTLAETITLAGGNMKVHRIRRGEAFIMPLPDVELREGDRLRVQDTPANLKRFEEALKAPLYSPDHQRVDAEHPLAAGDQVLAEVAVVQGSSLDRANLRYAQFIRRYQLVVLALHRAGRDILKPSEEIADVTLAPGDVLLVQGPDAQMTQLKRSSEFLVLDATMDLPYTTRAPIAFVILLGVIVAAATGIMPIAVSAIVGATVMILTRCLDFSSAIRAVSPAVVFVVVASLALGIALLETGATGYVTGVFLAVSSGASPTVLIGALMALLAILTNVVSNNAAAVIGTPIALNIAAELGLPAEPFVLAVLFGANMSFATPMAYTTNLLVMSAGNYTFREFVKVGTPLTVILWLTLTWVLAALYF
jgi:di/tricarboxylate transporter